MTTRAPFLTTRFGGYYHRAVPQEDIELTHVGATTPCGEYLRRFWHPFVLPTSCAISRFGSGSWERTSWCSATSEALWDSWSCIVLTEVPPWSLD